MGVLAIGRVGCWRLGEGLLAAGQLVVAVVVLIQGRKDRRTGGGKELAADRVLHQERTARWPVKGMVAVQKQCRDCYKWQLAISSLAAVGQAFRTGPAAS